ncbi:MAG: inositol monophosphatase [Candidatus Altiarchaeota archaeon]|nr:inositol monophosphatase [Candidatus Altiarchaeota archaeon]
MSETRFLEVAITAIQKAESIIMKSLSGDLQVIRKPDGSPVTHVDKDVENIIIKTIGEHFPDHGFLGEEFGRKNEESKFTWVIDPIECTMNFTRKLPIFSTELALMEGDEVILGISNAPLLHALMYAEKGKGAFLNGKPVKVSSISKLDEAYICYGGLAQFEKKERTQDLLDLLKHGWRNRGFGDFWGYQLLSQGRADAMVEAGAMIWDIAACKIIVEEAGGKLTDFNGDSILKKDSTSVVATNGKIHDEVLEFFK